VRAERLVHAVGSDSGENRVRACFVAERCVVETLADRVPAFDGLRAERSDDDRCRQGQAEVGGQRLAGVKPDVGHDSGDVGGSRLDQLVGDFLRTHEVVKVVRGRSGSWRTASQNAANSIDGAGDDASTRRWLARYRCAVRWRRCRPLHALVNTRRHQVPGRPKSWTRRQFTKVFTIVSCTRSSLASRSPVNARATATRLGNSRRYSASKLPLSSTYSGSVSMNCFPATSVASIPVHTRHCPARLQSSFRVEEVIRMRASDRQRPRLESNQPFSGGGGDGRFEQNKIRRVHRWTGPRRRWV
jgi:hypothetical protein